MAGRAVEEELPAPSGGSTRRDLFRLVPSSLTPTNLSFNCWRQLAILARKVGSPVSQRLMLARS